MASPDIEPEIIMLILNFISLFILSFGSIIFQKIINLLKMLYLYSYQTIKYFSMTNFKLIRWLLGGTWYQYMVFEETSYQPKKHEYIKTIWTTQPSLDLLVTNSKYLYSLKTTEIYE